MSRKNRNPHPRKPSLTDRYDLDYVNLPECRKFNRIIVKPLKTIFVNLDAEFWSDDFYVVRSLNDPMMRRIERKLGGVA